MKNRLLITISIFLLLVLIAGCDNLRFAATEIQKQNAWLHSRVAGAASEMSQNENSSESLQKLTRLSALQSSTFLADYGLPSELPVADNIEDIISQPSWDIAAIAARDAQEKPSSWDLADAGLELAIAMASILGGVYGIKFTGFLKQARQKSIALREIVNGNEMLKRQNSTLSAEFRTAHINQSPQTKQIVAQLKNTNG